LKASFTLELPEMCSTVRGKKEITSLAETSKNLRRPDIKINALESADREDNGKR
jgi:hypothetical protein